MKKKSGKEKKRRYHSVNRGRKRLITRRDAPTDNRAKLFHGGPDFPAIRLRELIGDGSKLPSNYFSFRREAVRQAIAAGRTNYVLQDEIDSLWETISEQFERAVLDGKADWFKRQAYACEVGDRRTNAEKDRGRFEAAVMRLLTVGCVPERKILNTCFVQRKDAQPLTEKEKREIRDLEQIYKHDQIEDIIGKSYKRTDDGDYVAVGEGLILEWTLDEGKTWYSHRFKNRRCARDCVRDVAKRINQEHRFL